MRLRFKSLVKLLRLRLWVSERLRPGEAQWTLIWAGVVGLCGGLASILFRQALEGMKWFYTRHTGHFSEVIHDLSSLQRLLIPTLGGLLAGLLMVLSSRLSRRQSAADYMEAIAIGDGEIRTRPTLTRSAAALAVIGSGASIGQEGPMVQLASWAASFIGRRARFALPRKRLIVACGAAAGIASAYNAPIAGALFVAEVILGSIAVPTFGPLLFSSVIAAVVVRGVLGEHPTYTIPSFERGTLWELFIYVPLGLLCGFAGVFFLRTIETGQRFMRKLPIGAPGRLALGGLVVGAISTLREDMWGNGFDVVSSMLASPGNWLPHVVIVVFVLKVAATTASFGSGAPGGVFTPTLFVGAAVGTFFGFFVHFVFSSCEVRDYTLVGMGCVLAATTQAPLMAIMMLFELTLDYDVILPLMLGCVTAHYTANGMGALPVYRHHLRNRLATPWSVASATEMTARDIMREEVPTVRNTDRFDQVARLFLGHRHDQAFVVDENDAYLGCIVLHDVKSVLGDIALGPIVVAHDIMRTDLPELSESSNFVETLRAFGETKAELLPIVAGELENRRLLGAVAKTDLLVAMAQTKSDGRQAAPATTPSEVSP